MIHKKIFTIVSALFLIIFLVNIVLSVEQSYCCEKTTYGSYCQNEPVAKCDSSINPLTNAAYRKAPTSCESTAYCKLGTCVNSQEGTCLEKTPQRVCEKEKGVWYDKDADELPQCKDGCCLIGNEAAYVTQTRCKRLASVYGLETNFRTDIDNEAECILSAVSEEKGACVFEKDFEKTCKLTTQKECLAMKTATEGGEEGVVGSLWGNLFGGKKEETPTTTITFHKGYLCSATSLGTNCGPKGGTTCVEGEDAVYFLDTCGNLANIYYSEKLSDENYWTYIKDSSESCGFGSSNVNSKTCGNCDYYSGSTCKSYRNSNSPDLPNYGNYICGDLSCKYEGGTYQHGETWCVTNTKKGLSENLPGSQSYRLACYDGEVTVEPCDAWRATVCIESKVEGFRNAVCSVNEWVDCTEQETEKDCLNIDKRNCKWIEGYSLLKDDAGYELVVDNEGKLVEQKKDKNGIPEDDRVKASCVPASPPGFNFWENETLAGEFCSSGNYYCIVEYEYGIFTTKKSIADEDNEKKRQHCVKNCRCVPGYKYGDSRKCDEGCESNEQFLKSVQGICGSLGDCGIGTNYIGQKGYYDKFGIEFGKIE